MPMIKIPFNDWSKSRLKEGIKHATSRYKRYGEEGDIFKAIDKHYCLDLVVKLPLWFILEYLTVSEGCISKDEFISVWLEIHPLKGLIRENMVWYHHFKEVKE